MPKKPSAVQFSVARYENSRIGVDKTSISAPKDYLSRSPSIIQTTCKKKLSVASSVAKYTFIDQMCSKTVKFCENMLNWVG